MNHHIAQLTSRVAACAVCLVLVAAGAPSYAAPPGLDQPPALASPQPVPAEPVAAEAAEEELLGRMLTPIAELHLRPGRADTGRLMRRSTGASLLYAVRSAWRGIVEYLFPPDGLFHRSEPLARVYDPELLADLERARALMATADVSPLTIAASPRRTPDAAADEDPASGAQPTEATPARTQAGSATATSLPDPAEIDFDFVANEREQDELRAQAAVAAETVSAAMTAVREKLAVLDTAREELSQRRALLEAGVLAEDAMRPAEERTEQALAAWEAAEGELLEAQKSYDDLAARIADLERQAADAHEALRRAREERARAAMAAAEVADPPPARTVPAAVTAEPAVQPVELRRADDAERPEADADMRRSFPMAHEVRELAAPRWDEVSADAPGMVSEVLVPEGTLVEAGDELMRVANLQLAQLTATVALADLPEFRVGRGVTLSFIDYPEAIFEGWVASVARGEEEQSAEVELLMLCESGPFADDPYLALRWMTLQAGIGEDKVDSRVLEPVCEPDASARTRLRLLDIFPTIGPGEAWAERATKPTVPTRDRYAGRLRLTPMPRFAAGGQTDETAARRLAAIDEWRASYIEGMTTSILDDGTAITYPADGELCDAVRAMLEGRVNHRPNLCAATMREALGWGLGDAHQWAERLPAMGYVEREDGLPRPGDILVWPFTYGPGHSQHIGIAVRQGRRLMLLSNLDGRLGTSEILGGYMAFHRPADEGDDTPS